MYKNKADEDAWRRAWREKNKKELAAKMRAWRAANKERYLALRKQARNTPEQKAKTQEYLSKTKEYRAIAQRQRDQQHKNKPEVKVRIAAQRKQRRSTPEGRDKDKVAAAVWRENNKDKRVVAENKRRAKQKSAVPPWFGEFDAFVVQEAAHLCILRKKTTGVEYQVDHIVPLQSKIVCGLHIAANIAVITATENQSKNNRHWPDMP